MHGLFERLVRPLQVKDIEVLRAPVAHHRRPPLQRRGIVRPRRRAGDETDLRIHRADLRLPRPERNLPVGVVPALAADDDDVAQALTRDLHGVEAGLERSVKGDRQADRELIRTAALRADGICRGAAAGDERRHDRRVRDGLLVLEVIGRTKEVHLDAVRIRIAVHDLLEERERVVADLRMREVKRVRPPLYALVAWEHAELGMVLVPLADACAVREPAVVVVVHAHRHPRRRTLRPRAVDPHAIGVNPLVEERLRARRPCLAAISPLDFLVLQSLPDRVPHL